MTNGICIGIGAGIGVGAINQYGWTPEPPTDGPPPGYRFVANTRVDPILYLVNSNGQYVVAPIGS